MSFQTIPSHLTPLDQLTTGCVVSADPSEKPDYDSDGQSKGKGPFVGRFGWFVPVKLLTGEEELVFPGRDPQIGFTTVDLRVTVWATTKPAVKAGECVIFENVLVGVNSNKKGEPCFYVQSTGVSLLGDDDSTSDSLTTNFA